MCDLCFFVKRPAEVPFSFFFLPVKNGLLFHLRPPYSCSYSENSPTGSNLWAEPPVFTSLLHTANSAAQ